MSVPPPPIFQVSNPLDPSDGILCTPLGTGTTVTLTNWGIILDIKPPGHFDNKIGTYNPGSDGKYSIKLVINYQCTLPILAGGIIVGIFGKGKILNFAKFPIVEETGRGGNVPLIAQANQIIIEVINITLFANDAISTFISTEFLNRGGNCIKLKTSEWTITKS